MRHIMKLLCFSIPLLLYIFDFNYSHNLNVGTVLFTKGDLYKKCWTEPERTLLIARQVMQGVLPDPESMNIANTGTITVLLEYFQSCYHVVAQSATGKTQHIMFLALSDAFGGYLRANILPVARYSYYAGQIKYSEARKVFQFYQEIKDFLRTNGAGWAEPRRPTSRFNVRPLKLSTKGYDTACSQLYFKHQSKLEMLEEDKTTEESNQTVANKTTEIPKVTESLATGSTESSASLLCRNLEEYAAVKEKFMDLVKAVNRQRSNPVDYDLDPSVTSLTGRNFEKIEKLRKDAKRLTDRLFLSAPPALKSDSLYSTDSRNVSRRGMLRHWKRGICSCSKERKQEASPPKELIIPLPVLDDSDKPKTIGVPFKTRPLRSLQSPQSVSILVRYYITVLKCLVFKSTDKTDLFNFNVQFRAWLNSQIVPHLNDEEWYPAFGGVLRVIETIKIMSSEESDKCCRPSSNDIGFLFSKGFPIDGSDDYKKNECHENQFVRYHTPEDRTYITMIVLAIVFGWIFIFCCCICCCSAQKSEENRFGVEDAKKLATEPTNSFIVQCLVRFFKREENEEKVENKEREIISSSMSARDNMRQLYTNEGGIVGGGSSHNSLASWLNGQGGRSEAKYVQSSDGRPPQNWSNNHKGTIVLPAQITQLPANLPLGLTSLWPFRNEMKGIKQPPEEIVISSRDQEGLPRRISKREMEQCKTIWKRAVSEGQTSESYPEIVVEKKKVRPKTGKEKPDPEEVPSSKSSYSNNSNSDDLNRKRIKFSRKSKKHFEYPRSYRYSYNSSPNSYSSSQVESDARMELYDHIAACHNAFAKKLHQEVPEKSKSESGSDGETTSTSECLSSEK